MTNLSATDLFSLTFQAPTPQNGQTHSDNPSRQFANELFECVWTFYGVGAYRVKEGFLKLPLQNVSAKLRILIMVVIIEIVSFFT